MQNQIINMCRVLIGPNAVVTDDQINDAIERVSLIFPNMDIAQVKSELLSLYGVRIQDFQILEGNERRQPWLRDFKAERKSTWDFWVRYKQYLSEQKGFAPLVIQKLDEMSDRILAYIIHSGFISGYQNRYGDNLKPPTNVYHRMTA